MADSDTTQPKQITVSLEAFNELKALTENIRAKAAAREAAAREAKAAARKAAAREAKAAVREAKAAARKAMADSGTAQHADIKKLLDSAAAIITNIQLNREELDEAEWEEAIAEVKRLHREAREKLFANSRRKANLLPTGAELACVSFLFGSLLGKVLF